MKSSFFLYPKLIFHKAHIEYSNNNKTECTTGMVLRGQVQQKQHKSNSKKNKKNESEKKKVFGGKKEKKKRTKVHNIEMIGRKAGGGKVGGSK